MAPAPLLEAARRVAAEAAQASATIDATRAVPDHLVHELAAAGCLRLYVPRSLGGAEADPLLAIEVLETLAAADGSLGWTAFILNGSFFATWLEPAVAKEILADPPDAGMAGALAPIGRAHPCADGFRLEGRWPFNSGSTHAGWFSEGGLVVDADGEVQERDGRPDWRLFFVPAADVEILDTWHAAGLRGTASHDVSVQGALVPAERTVHPIFATAPSDAPHFRWTCFALISSMLAAFPLGVARRALDEFATVAVTKSRRTTTPLVDSPPVAIAIGRAEADWRAARALLVDAVGTAWDRALAGDRLDSRHRIDLRLAALHAMRIGVQVVDTVFELAGGGALYESSPLQRCWRDVHAGSHHVFFSHEDHSRVGRAVLTGDGSDWLI